MRGFATCVVVLALAGCGAKYKAKAPVLTGWERTQGFPDGEGSKARYSQGDPRIAAPVLPVMAFGAAFDVDLVVKPRKSDYDMIELGRMATPDGPVWVALETRSGSGDQVLVADVQDIDAWMPELPLARKSARFGLEDLSNEEAVDVRVSYENLDGRKIDLTFKGDPPTRFQRRRNGPTLGHSANQLLAAVDVQHRESAFKANLQIDGKGQSLARVGGIVPFQFALEQTMGGMAIGSYNIVTTDAVAWNSGPTARVLPRPGAAAPPPPAEPTAPADPADDFSLDDDAAEPTAPATEGAEGSGQGMEGGSDTLAPISRPDGDTLDPISRPDLPVPMDEVIAPVMGTGKVANFKTVHAMASGNQVEQDWEVSLRGTRAFATQTSPQRTLTYEYLVDDAWGALELTAITVTPAGRGTPATSIQISPALPDLRKPFNGKMQSRFVMDINGQQSYATGTVEAWWTETGVKVRVTPEAPDWTKDRGLVTTITYGTPGAASVRTELRGAE